MDIAVIVMGVIAVIAGVAGFIMERSSGKKENDTEKNNNESI